MSEIIRYGMVGGGLNAFIGDVHRKGLAFDPRTALVAGCFSRNPEMNAQTADACGVEPARVYADYETMAERESARADGIRFVVIVTPNVTHYEIAKTFLEHGIHVSCDKPLCFTVEQAETLCRIARARNRLFCVTYAYAGYTMMRVMREMIADGRIGRIVSVNGEYVQDWLIDALKPEGVREQAISTWRMDPAQSGIANCVGDIGTHLAYYMRYVTGLEIDRLLATTDHFGQTLEMNANILLSYKGGVRGAYWCSQVAAGQMNGLRLRVCGDEGSLEWTQHTPDTLRYTKKNQAPELLSRGTNYLAGEAAKGSRLPFGHPEGLYVAFANLYRSFLSAVDAAQRGEPTDGFDFPRAEDGLFGVRFVHAVIDSAADGSRWVAL